MSRKIEMINRDGQISYYEYRNGIKLMITQADYEYIQLSMTKLINEKDEWTIEGIDYVTKGHTISLLPDQKDRYNLIKEWHNHRQKNTLTLLEALKLEEAYNGNKLQGKTT